MYANSITCVRVKEGDSECFRIHGGLRQDYIMFPCVFNVHMDALLK